MSNNTNRPGNIFGSVNLPVGNNIADAVRGSVQQIGIPDNRLKEVDKIFQKALNGQEYAICCRGFGLGCERLTQAAIAAEMKLDRNEVSRIARKAVDKLAAAPYKGKLLGMVPRVDDLMKVYTQHADSKSLVEAQVRQINGLRKQVDDLKVEKASLESDNATLKDQLAAMAKRLEESEKRAQRASTGNATMMDLMSKGSALACQNLEGNLDKLYVSWKEATLKQFKEAFAEAFAEVLGQDIADRLIAIGISNLGILTRMSRKNLVGARVPTKVIDEIEDRLAHYGLSLRAG